MNKALRLCITLGVLYVCLSLLAVDRVVFANFADHISSYATALSTSSSTLFQAKDGEPHNNTKDRKPKLADGCYHIFLDVGANRGMNSRFLMEPERFPKATRALGHFEQYFGAAPRDNRDVCIFSFEPNPVHYARHDAMQDTYARMGWRYHPFHAGVGVKDEEMSVPYVPNVKKADWGFSVLGLEQTNQQQNVTNVKVPIMRLASFLLEEVQGRTLPERRQFESNTASEQPHVVMKMDIEGMELYVFPDLILTGAMCQIIDFIYMELFHCTNPNFFPMKHPSTGWVVAKNEQECFAYQTVMTNMILSNPHCKTAYKWGDDESYLNDNSRFPVPDSVSSLAQDR